MELQIGQQIGNYHLVSVIAQGAYANVYKAEHNVLANRVVAIKILHTAFVDPDEDHDVLYQEARILEQLKHPHILAVIDFGTYQNWPYIVKDYAPNGSLRDYLRSLKGHPMPIDEVIYVLRQVGDALQFAHDHNVVHCDLKPENILFNAENALISDFDIARVLESTNSYQRGIGGTPSYMAPEQFQGKVRRESDQYALGCMAYEMVTGKRPFEGENAEILQYNHFHLEPAPPSQLRPDLPQYLEPAILRAMSRKYSARFTDVASFIAAIDPVQNAVVLDNWSQVVPQSGPKLILHEQGKGKGEVDESLFYEETVSMYAESTVVDAIPVRRRAPRTTPTGAKPAASRSRVTASSTKKTSGQSSLAKTAAKKTTSTTTPTKKTASAKTTVGKTSPVKKTTSAKATVKKASPVKKATTIKKTTTVKTAARKATPVKKVAKAPEPITNAMVERTAGAAFRIPGNRAGRVRNESVEVSTEPKKAPARPKKAAVDGVAGKRKSSAAKKQI
jgi:serine/threonine protein kinase